MTNVLIVGAGRMGLRHLRGVAEEARNITVVYHKMDVEQQVHDVLKDASFEGAVDIVPSIKQAGNNFDAAILTATAEGRAERFEQVLSLNNILLEKPLEQSRREVHRMQAMAVQSKSDIRCNHVYREVALFEDIAGVDAPVNMTVNAGAIGLGCGGIHWIDLALYLSNAGSGKLLNGKLQNTPIASGRGPQFRDFGGVGLFEFRDGSTLSLCVDSESSAGPVCVITQAHRQFVIDNMGRIMVHERGEEVTLPNYLYGQGYKSEQDDSLTKLSSADQTHLWMKHVKNSRQSKLPTLNEAAIAHELLFDLLEIRGDKDFPIT